jgi:hypothetical protein
MIHNILKACVTVAAKKDIRFYMNAVHIRKNHDGKLVIEASDGHMGLIVTCHNVPGFDIAAENILIDRKNVENALKVFKPINSVTDNTIETFGFTPVDGRFPDLERALRIYDEPKQDPEVGVNVNLMERLMKAVGILLKGQKYPCARMRPRGANDPVLFEGGNDNFTFVAGIMPVRM